MTPAEAERLKWSLAQLNQAAYDKHHTDHDDDPTETSHDADHALGIFCGHALIYTDRGDELSLAAKQLSAHVAEHGENPQLYGAVTGMIQALTERTP